MKIFLAIAARFNNWRFKRRFSKLQKKRAKEPPPPPTRLDELHALAANVNKMVELLTFKVTDAVAENLLTREKDEAVIGACETAKFSVCLIKNELFIKVRAQDVKEERGDDTASGGV